ncbi:MAG: IS630 family transposase [Propionivibrio sp.]|nr:IS630 family transposase [Propionivibrio sp.]
MLAAALCWPALAQAAQKKPNILVIWGDDIGYWNVSAYNQGMMGYKTPNIDRIAKEGALFTDWYGQQSCTAGRAAFITGQSPFRTGLLKVGLPGAKEGLQARDVTIAELPYALWSRVAVAELIADPFGLRLPVRTMGTYLKRWGFTPQKPIRRAYEQSPTAVKHGMDTAYPEIAARAKKEGAEIHWGNETGLRSDDVRGRSFAPKGETPAIRVSSKRAGLSIISTVTNKGQMRWKIFDGALNSDILIDFLRRLIKGATKKVFMILDNLRVHHSKPVKAWLAKHTQAIEVFYLPSYDQRKSLGTAPELNPDEMVNADIKQAVTKQAPARTKLQLVNAASRHLRSVQKQPQRIRNYFQHDPVKYAA